MLLREPKTPNITTEHRTKLHFSCTWSPKNVIQVALFSKCLKTGKQIKGGFPVIAEITRRHTFTKEINHAGARSQYFNETFYPENNLRMSFAMIGKPA